MQTLTRSSKGNVNSNFIRFYQESCHYILPLDVYHFEFMIDILTSSTCSYSHIKYPESLECGMSGSTQAKIYLSTLLPIAVTAAVLPQNGMSLYPRLDKLRSIPCDPVSIEKVQNFFTNAGIGSTGIFLAIVLGPVVVRSIFRWQNRRRREREQRLSAPVVMPLGEERKEEEKKSLIYGDNPDYHAGVDLTPTPPSSNTAERQPKRFRHLRIHSLDELPPPTLDDISRQSISWSCPVSPVLESAPTLNKPGKRRSPFNPVVPGMKTTWEEGVDPVTGRRWKRKLVVYTSLETLDKTSDEKMVGELGSQENGSPPRS